MKKALAFVLATAFLASSASAAKPSDTWFLCKQFLNPQICSFFR